MNKYNHQLGASFDIPPSAPWGGEGAGALVVRLRAEQARARAAGGRGTGQKSSSNNNRCIYVDYKIDKGTFR